MHLGWVHKFPRKLQVRLYCFLSADGLEALQLPVLISCHGRPRAPMSRFPEEWLHCLPSQGGILAGVHCNTTLAIANDTAAIECFDGCPCLVLGPEGCKTKALGESRASVPCNLQAPGCRLSGRWDIAVHDAVRQHLEEQQWKHQATSAPTCSLT